MGAWAKVTTEPLGLAGYALFLIFVYIGRVNRHDKRKWLPVVAFSCAAAPLRGFVHAYLQTTKPVLAPGSANKPGGSVVQQTNQVDQSSSGDGSSSVQGVHDHVTVALGQSDGKTKASKSKSKP